jgi:hypothetical protein
MIIIHLSVSLICMQEIDEKEREEQVGDENWGRKINSF